MSSTNSVTVNGVELSLDGVSTHTSLLHLLRERGLTGSKEGCNEGDCGACTVCVIDTDAEGRTTARAINSCIALARALAGREIVTVEGLARDGELHPVQDAMVRAYGSQCGYCTPGFVMSMYEGYLRPDVEGGPAISDQLSGNLCRCTGYRPIRDAMRDALRHPRRGDELVQLRARAIPAHASLRVEQAGERLDRPTTLADLLELRAAHPDAELLAGATEIGVYINKQRRRFPHLIATDGVAELAAITRNGDEWRVGGAATLTALEETAGRELPCLQKMLSVFASRQIRSRATLAGNLVTASPIGDLAPVLLALDAELVLASRGGERAVPIAEFFVDYRRTALRRDELVREIRFRSPRARAGHALHLDSFKVSKRRELDISIVAAALRVEVDPAGVVVDARLAFGGVAKMPVRARETEARLIGAPWSKETIELAEASLSRELSPIADVRAGDAFRRGLTGSLLRKLFTGDRSAGQDEPLDFTEGEACARADASRALSHDSARGHVTGDALYVDDEAARRGGMLELWPIRARVTCARLTGVDAEAARAMPGVVAVLLAGDVPGDNDAGAIRHDEPLFAADDVRFHGQAVGVVVAATREQARLAAEAVVLHHEERPALLGVDAAIEAGSYHTEPHVIRRGDAAAALAASPRVVEGTLHIGGQEHFYLESQAAWAERGDDGDVTVSSSTQHPSEVQAIVSHVLHAPRNRVTVIAPRMGGGFGGKETQGNAIAAWAALAAWKTGRPCRVQLDRDVDMELTGKRHPFRADYRAAYELDGRLTALEASLVSDGGYALDLSESICDRALFHIDNAYYVPNVDVRGRVAKTNVVSHTAFRGFGGPQGMLVIEEVLDRVARALGLPPDLVRRRNLYSGEGETATTHYGQPLDDDRLTRIWDSLLASSSFAERRREIDAWNAGQRGKKRGLAITPVKFGISFTATWLNQAGAVVLLYRDGTAQVNHGGTEMGQGLHAKVQGVAMRELGLSAARVRVMKTRTDKVPNTSATAASSGADLNGAAVKDACLTLRARLAPVAARLLEARVGAPIPPAAIVFGDDHAWTPQFAHERVPFPEICEAAYVTQVQLSATGFYSTPAIGYDRQRGHGKPFHYFACGAAVSEVEIDAASGMKRVLRVDVLHDVGDSLNPGVDRGQIEGGFVQGMGWLTAEELVWTGAGKLASHSASTYQIPSIGDAPADMRVATLSRAAQPGTIHGSKAVGEPPLMLAISVREALRDAIGAFGGAPVVDLPCPSTHEAIWHAVRGRGEAHLSFLTWRRSARDYRSVRAHTSPFVPLSPAPSRKSRQSTAARGVV
ncbi:MAG: xanthine dehydrogenase molybdopterin binding subunit [Polyangiaceae bacterium]|nr:xanthine dehydrogenase molybdopterin binding subunit [Polyangiaceae bacterium]